MHGLDLVNTAIFVGAALVMIGIFSSLVATRFGAPLLLVFLVVGMLAGEDGPGGLRLRRLPAPPISSARSRSRSSCSTAACAPASRLSAACSRRRCCSPPSACVITAAVAGAAGWLRCSTSPIDALLLGAIVASTDAAAVFFLMRTGGLRLQHRVGATLEIESRHQRPDRGLPRDRPDRVHPRRRPHARLGTGARALMEASDRRPLRRSAGGFALVAILNRLGMPGGLHPLFVVAGAVLSRRFTSLVGGSGLLAVYVAGLVMANRPVRAYPSIVGFHDAVTWLCQIVMFLVLGLLVTPTTLLGLRRRRGSLVALVLTLVAPAARGLALPGAFGFARAGEAVHLLGRPARRGLDLPRRDPDARRRAERRGLLQHRLLRGAGLAAGAGLDADRGARRLGVALSSPRRRRSRVEIDLPGQTEQEMVGYAGRRGQRDPRPQPAAGLGAGADGRAQGRTSSTRSEAGPLRPGDYATSSSAAHRLPRLDSLFRESPDVARRLGLLFGELPIRGETRVGEVAQILRPRLRGARARGDAGRMGGGAARRPADARRDPAHPRAAAGGAAAGIRADRQHGPAARGALAGGAGRGAAGRLEGERTS